MLHVIATILMGFLVLSSGCSGGSDGKVLAKVNKVQITAGDLEREVDQIPFHSRAMLAGPDGQKRLLDEMVKRELLIQEAERRGLDSRAEIKARIEENRKGILLNALLIEEIRDKVKVTDAEVRAYFDKHRDELETSEVHLKQVVLKDSDEAQKIHERLLKNEPFEDLARKVSVDKSSGPRGGDIGFVSRGQLLPEVEKVAFSLKPEEVSNVIKTPRGYHILKVVERKKTVTLKYDQVKDRLQPFAEADKQRERLESWIGELRKGASLKVYEARLPIPLKDATEAPKPSSEPAPGTSTSPPPSPPRK